ncbi:MAG: YgaP family membrane protein [Candidatus Limnocylindria bacterium]
MKPKINEGPIDRMIRIALGIALVASAVLGGPGAPLLYLIWLVAAIALVTGVVGFCPLYAIFRFSTAPARR